MGVPYCGYAKEITSQRKVQEGRYCSHCHQTVEWQSAEGMGDSCSSPTFWLLILPAVFHLTCSLNGKENGCKLERVLTKLEERAKIRWIR